ncbi:MAG: FitA-like ribbon-helix-helix domain-containing protein, partial [Longimicrobiales bacterium]
TPNRRGVMPDITVHDVPQQELDAIESRAARHGRSTEAELMHLIHEAAGEERLVTELERATKAVEATLSRPTAAAPPRRRYRAVEPTPRQR